MLRGRRCAQSAAPNSASTRLDPCGTTSPCRPTRACRRQDKKLKEGFARLQQENEFLRQQVARLSGGGSVNLPASLAGMGLGGGGGGGGPGGGGGGHAMRMGVAGMEDGLGRTRPGTALGMR